MWTEGERATFGPVQAKFLLPCFYPICRLETLDDTGWKRQRLHQPGPSDHQVEQTPSPHPLTYPSCTWWVTDKCLLCLNSIIFLITGIILTNVYGLKNEKELAQEKQWHWCVETPIFQLDKWQDLWPCLFNSTSLWHSTESNKYSLNKNELISYFRMNLHFLFCILSLFNIYKQWP